jgi:hypothetical protein
MSSLVLRVTNTPDLSTLLEEWGAALENPKFRTELLRYLKVGRPEDRKALREILHLRKTGHTWDEVDDLRNVSRGVSSRFLRRWKKRHPGQNI